MIVIVEQNEKSREELDPTLIGLVKRKEKIKPGYKKN